MRFEMANIRFRNVIIDHPSCVRVIHPPTGNRDALRKRSALSWFAAGYNFIHEERVYFLRVPSKSPVPLGFLYSSLFSSSSSPFISAPVALAEDDSASRGALAGDCYVRKKPRRGQKAWII